MKLTCSNKMLRDGLSVVRRAVTSRAKHMPILEHVLLEATSAGLTLAASNLEWHIVHQLPAEVEVPGRVTIPAEAFAAWVGTLPPDDTSNLVLDPDALTLTQVCAATHALFYGMDADELPLLPEPSGPTVDVDAAALRTALARVAFAASDDVSRYVLTAVLLALRGRCPHRGCRRRLSPLRGPSPVGSTCGEPAGGARPGTCAGAGTPADRRDRDGHALCGR